MCAMIPMFRTRDNGTSRIRGAPFPFSCVASAAAISLLLYFSSSSSLFLDKPCSRSNLQRQQAFGRSITHLKPAQAQNAHPPKRRP